MKKDISLILKIFYEEVVKEAEAGCICIDDWQYHCHFTTKMSSETKVSDYVVLNIHNKQIFNELLCTYVFLMEKYLLENKQYYNNDAIYFFNPDKSLNKKLVYKAICTFLWANATFDDFLEPEAFLQNRINFFNDLLYRSYSEERIFLNNIENYFPDFQKVGNISLKGKIERQNPTSENLYALELYLEGENGKYILPKIYYGISDNICYLGAIQKKKQIRQKFHKDIERIFYKFDHEIPKEYKNIEPNILLALCCFLMILKKENVTNLICNAYYPLRNELKQYLVKKEKLSLEEYDRIFQNVTLRYFNAFTRLSFHFEGIRLQSYPFDATSSLIFQINTLNSNLNDNLLNGFMEAMVSTQKLENNEPYK